MGSWISAEIATSVPGSCFYLTTYEACKNGFRPYLLKQTPDGKPPTLLAQAPLIVSAALAAERKRCDFVFPNITDIPLMLHHSGLWSDMVSIGQYCHIKHY